MRVALAFIGLIKVGKIRQIFRACSTLYLFKWFLFVLVLKSTFILEKGILEIFFRKFFNKNLSHCLLWHWHIKYIGRKWFISASVSYEMNGLVWVSQARYLLKVSFHLWHCLHDRSVYEKFHKFSEGEFIWVGGIDWTRLFHRSFAVISFYPTFKIFF